MGQFLANLVVALLRVVFHAGERLGVHVTPNAFFSPVPDTRLLPDALWSSKRALPGVDWRDGAQIQLLSESTAYIAEVESLSSELGGPLAYRLENPKFGTVDAHMAYSLVRRHRPRRIVEIGSGWSTLVLMAALDANATQGHPGELVACEPYPDERLVLAARKDHVRLEPQPLQALPLSVFTDLSADDIVLVDSSHVLK